MMDERATGPTENVRIWPGDASRGEIEVVGSHAVWSNETARLVVDRVRVPRAGDGDDVLEDEHFRLAHAEAYDHGVVIAPIAEDDRVLLVRQFRHPVRMWIRELPRGGRKKGEPVVDCARRELREELGVELVAHHALGRMAPDSGQQEGYTHLVAARVRDAAPATPEDTEVIDRVVPMTYTALRRACEDGTIVDGYTIGSVMRLGPHFDGDRFAFRDDRAPASGEEYGD